MKGETEPASYLVQHKYADTLHITGSDATYNRIVWGHPSEWKDRMAKGQVCNSRYFSCELGCVSPWNIFPGTWDSKSLKHQGKILFTKTYNFFFYFFLFFLIFLFFFIFFLIYNFFLFFLFFFSFLFFLFTFFYLFLIKAIQLARSMTFNNGFVCASPKVAIVPQGWEHKSQFIDFVKEELEKIPSKPGYYKG